MRCQCCGLAKNTTLVALFVEATSDFTLPKIVTMPGWGSVRGLTRTALQISTKPLNYKSAMPVPRTVVVSTPTDSAPGPLAIHHQRRRGRVWPRVIPALLAALLRPAPESGCGSNSLHALPARHALLPLQLRQLQGQKLMALALEPSLSRPWSQPTPLTNSDLNLAPVDLSHGTSHRIKCAKRMAWPASSS